MKFFFSLIIYVFTTSFVQIQAHTYILSYPHSGNTWMRYCLEFLTKRPTQWDQSRSYDPNPTNFPLGRLHPLETDYNKPPIIKTHFADTAALATEHDKIILLLRNYKECIVRNNPSRIDHKNFISYLINHPFAYLIMLNNFDKSHAATHLVYYEDFMKNPRDVLQTVLKFLDEDDGLLDNFMENYDIHKQNSIAAYEAHVGPSRTKEEKLHYHSATIPLEDRQKIDQCIQEKYPYLWEKYLSRYAD